MLAGVVHVGNRKPTCSKNDPEQDCRNSFALGFPVRDFEESRRSTTRTPSRTQLSEAKEARAERSN